jgi:hypothetical protein
MGKNQIRDYCEMKNGIIDNSSDIFNIETPEQKIMYLLSKNSRVSTYEIEKIPKNKLSFFFNRYFRFLKSYNIDDLSDYAKKMYFISLHRKLKTGEMGVNGEKYVLEPLFDYDLDMIINPKNIVKDWDMEKPITLLEYVILNSYLDTEKYIIPLFKRIKETGRVLSPSEQEHYDNYIEDWKEYYPELG